MPHHTVRTERPADFLHRTITESLRYPGLSAEDRLLVWISSAASTVQPEVLDTALRLALTGGISVLQAKEVILQNYLFCGFPAAIEGLIVLSDVRTTLSLEDMNYEEPRDDAAQERDGTQLCRRVYGDHFDRLMDNMTGLSRDLQTWMIREGYGKVLSRPVLPIVTRELCIVAALATTGRTRQLHSHLRGALHVGASISQLRTVIDTIRPLIPDGHAADADTLLEKYS